MSRFMAEEIKVLYIPTANMLDIFLKVIYYPSTTHPTSFPTNRKFRIEIPANQTQ